MDWTEALEVVIERTKHERYRDLCAETHPSHERFRAEMIRQATGQSPAAPAPRYPSLVQQAWNVSKAATGFVTSGFQIADQAEQERRIAICHTCELYDPVKDRCLKCGCKISLKTRIASSHCPKVPPLW